MKKRLFKKGPGSFGVNFPKTRRKNESQKQKVFGAAYWITPYFFQKDILLKAWFYHTVSKQDITKSSIISQCYSIIKLKKIKSKKS